MSFSPGDVVRSLRDLQMAGFVVPDGSRGTVTSVTLQTSVLFDTFQIPLTVSDGDIQLAGDSQAQTAAAKQNVAAAAAPLKRVRAIVATHAGGLSIPSGATGLVTSDAPMMNASWVLFDGMPSDVLVSNRTLEAV